MTSKIFSCLILILGFLPHLPAFAADNTLPEVVVSADRVPDPDEKVGSYQQPRWTTMRSFTNSRVYVVPEGTVELEYWIRQQTTRDPRERYYLLQKEIEVGLGHGLQLDFYQNDQKDTGTTIEEFEGLQFELRWALAKWGVIPMNPTLYFEYHQRETGPDKFEFRILLGDDVGPGWRVTTNLQYEVELWGQKEREIAATVAVGRKLTNAIMAGVEAKAEGDDDVDTRGHFSWGYYAGPAVRWTPIAKTNILLSHLIGFNRDANYSESRLIVGLEL